MCGSTSTLAGNNAVTGAGTWTLVSGAGTITTPSSPTSGLTGLGVGANVFQWTIANAPCASTNDQVTINITSTPTVAAAGLDQTVCGSTATLAGNNAVVGAGTWTLISGAGTITTPSSANTTITGFSIAGIYTYIWSLNGCSDSVNVIVTAKPNIKYDDFRWSIEMVND